MDAIKRWWRGRRFWQKAVLYFLFLGLVAPRLLSPISRWYLGEETADSNMSVGPMLIFVAVLVGVLVLSLGLAWLNVIRPASKMAKSFDIQPSTTFAMPSETERKPLVPEGDVRTAFDAPATVATLQENGFVPSGSYNLQGEDHRATFSCLLSDDGTMIATVTPTSFAVESYFDGKILVTEGSTDVVAQPEWILHQSAGTRGVGPALSMHRDALRQLATMGLQPRHFDRTAALDTTVASARAELSTMNLVKNLFAALAVPDSDKPDPVTDEAIAAWIQSDEAWTAVG